MNIDKHIKSIFGEHPITKEPYAYNDIDSFVKNMVFKINAVVHFSERLIKLNICNEGYKNDYYFRMYILENGTKIGRTHLVNVNINDNEIFEHIHKENPEMFITMLTNRIAVYKRNYIIDKLL